MLYHRYLGESVPPNITESVLSAKLKHEFYYHFWYLDHFLTHWVVSKHLINESKLMKLYNSKSIFILVLAPVMKKWRRRWHPTPILLPGKPHGWRSLVGCSPWGRRVGHDWATSLSLFTFMHWRQKWQPTPVFFPGESQGRRSLLGCRLWGGTESETTETTYQWRNTLYQTNLPTNNNYKHWIKLLKDNNYLKALGNAQRRRQWHPTPVLLPGKSHGWRSAGVQPRWIQGIRSRDRVRRIRKQLLN